MPFWYPEIVHHSFGPPIPSVLHESCWQSINAQFASLLFCLLAPVEGTTVCFEIPLHSPPPKGGDGHLTTPPLLGGRTLWGEISRGGGGGQGASLGALCKDICCTGLCLTQTHSQRERARTEQGTGTAKELEPVTNSVWTGCLGECHARSAKFWMSANTRTLLSNTRTLLLAPFVKFLVPYWFSFSASYAFGMWRI